MFISSLPNLLHFFCIKTQLNVIFLLMIRICVMLPRTSSLLLTIKRTFVLFVDIVVASHRLYLNFSRHQFGEKGVAELGENSIFTDVGIDLGQHRMNNHVKILD